MQPKITVKPSCINCRAEVLSGFTTTLPIFDTNPNIFSKVKVQAFGDERRRPWALPGLGIHSLHGQCVPVSHHPQTETFPPNIKPKLPFFQFVPITPFPVTAIPDEELLSSFPVDPLQILGSCCEVSTQPSLLQPSFLSLSLLGRCSTAFTNFVASPGLPPTVPCTFIGDTRTVHSTPKWGLTRAA